MKSKTVQILCNPANHSPLKLVEDNNLPQRKQFLLDERTKERFPITAGIPMFLNDGQLSDTSRKHLNFYENIAPLYDVLHKFQAGTKGGETKIREEFLKKIQIKPNDKVLEVSVGTGANLRYLPQNANYYGLDISWQMLTKCKTAIKRGDFNAELVLGDAENIPFKNSVFDVVLNVCALRLFNNREQAIGEMLRVAKPGAKILIVDQKRTEAPVKLFPGNVMVEVVDAPAWGLYCLTATKPGFL